MPLRGKTKLSGSGKTLGFPKAVHLLRTADFKKVYSEGRRHSLDSLIAFARANRLMHSRIGFTLPRALGKAVERNRMRRRLREAARRHLQDLGPGWDVVFHPRRGTLTAEFGRLEEIVQKFFLSLARQLPPSGTNEPTKSER